MQLTLNDPRDSFYNIRIVFRTFCIICVFKYRFYEVQNQLDPSQFRFLKHPFMKYYE